MSTSYHTISISKLASTNKEIDIIAKALDPIFDCRGYIAGGFARHIFNIYSGLPTSSYGDIDVFYESKDDLEYSKRTIGRCIEPTFMFAQETLEVINASNNPVSTYGYGLSNNAPVTTTTQNALSLRFNKPLHGSTYRGSNSYRNGDSLQMITKFFGEPKRLVNNFDLKNSQLFLTADGLTIADGWEELEEQALIHIHKPQDLVPPRIRKYMLRLAREQKKNAGLTEQSKEVLLELLLNSAETGDWGRLHTPVNATRELIKFGNTVVDDSSLLYFVDKLGTVLTNQYDALGKRLEKDFAIDQIQQRLTKKHVAPRQVQTLPRLR